MILPFGSADKNLKHLWVFIMDKYKDHASVYIYIYICILAQVWSTTKQNKHTQQTKTTKELNVANKFGTMKMTMFSPKGSVKLRGQAAVVRDFGQVLHAAWKKFCPESLKPDGLEVYRKIEETLRLSVKMEAILDDHKTEFVLPGLSGLLPCKVFEH